MLELDLRSCRNISLKALESLAKLPNITRLIIANTKSNDTVLSSILNHCKNLSYIDASFTDINSKSINLSDYLHIKTLIISSNNTNHNTNSTTTKNITTTTTQTHKPIEEDTKPKELTTAT